MWHIEPFGPEAFELHLVEIRDHAAHTFLATHSARGQVRILEDFAKE
jgi:hypothetical protein